MFGLFGKNSSNLKLVESNLYNEFKLKLDQTPHKESIIQNYERITEEGRLSHEAQTSLFYKLVIMNYLGACKIMRDKGQITDSSKLTWLIKIADRSVYWSKIALDHVELEQLTIALNENISRFFESFGIFYSFEHKNLKNILLYAQTELFKIYGVTKPTDAQKMKASAYLCIAGIAILNDFGGGDLDHIIDQLVEETKELTRPLVMKVGELSKNNKQLNKIIQDLPDSLNVTGSTIINGLAAFEAIYFSIGEDLMMDILNHSNDPMGIHGYAAIVVADGIFGDGKIKEHVMDVSLVLLGFTKAIGEII